MVKVIIDKEWCKGCGLCVHVCPKGGLQTAKKLNEKGYFPAEKCKTVRCTGCGMCMLVCPDMAIQLEDDDEI